MQSVSISVYQKGDDLIIEGIRKIKLAYAKPQLHDLNRAYSFYTNREIFVENNKEYTSILVPLLVESEYETVS